MAEARQLRFDDGKDPQALRTIGEVAAASPGGQASCGCEEFLIRFGDPLA